MPRLVNILPYGAVLGRACALTRSARSAAGELERPGPCRYTSEIGLIIGPQKDIPAPDVGKFNGKVMAWMSGYLFHETMAPRLPAW